MKNRISALLLLSVLALSCDRNDDDSSSTNNTTLITRSSWQYESGGIDQDRNGTIDITLESTGQVQPCVLDNTGTFQTGGAGIADEGATKCSPTLPQTTPFTWSFASSETVLTVSGGGLFGQGGNFKIQSLTATRLSLSKDTTLAFGGISFPASLILNLKH